MELLGIPFLVLVTLFVVSGVDGQLANVVLGLTRLCLNASVMTNEPIMVQGSPPGGSRSLLPDLRGLITDFMFSLLLGLLESIKTWDIDSHALTDPLTGYLKIQRFRQTHMILAVRASKPCPKDELRTRISISVSTGVRWKPCPGTGGRQYEAQAGYEGVRRVQVPQGPLRCRTARAALHQL